MDDGGGWVAITLDVPGDAAVLDFVLKGEHGATDDNSKRGYHLPVAGGTGVVPKLHIAHAAVEMAPIAKVGCERREGVCVCVSVCLCASCVLLLLAGWVCSHGWVPVGPMGLATARGCGAATS